MRLGEAEGGCLQDTGEISKSNSYNLAQKSLLLTIRVGIGEDGPERQWMPANYIIHMCENTVQPSAVYH